MAGRRCSGCRAASQRSSGRPALGGERRPRTGRARARPTARRRPRRTRAGRWSSAAVRARSAEPRSAAPVQARRADLAPGRRPPRGRRRPRAGRRAPGRPAGRRRPSRSRPSTPSAGIAVATSEPSVHRLEPLPGALVGIGDDPLLARRERRPAPVALAVEQAGHRVVRDRPAPAPGDRPGSATPPSRRRGGGRAPDRRPGAPCRRRGGARPTRRAGDRRRRRAPRSAPPASRRPRPRRARGARTRVGDRGRAAGRRPPPARAPSSSRWYPTIARTAGDAAWSRRPTGRDRCGRRSPAVGTSPVTGIAHRNAGRRGRSWPSRRRPPARPRTRGAAAVERPPSARTVIPLASKPTTTVPSRSVRRTRAPAAASRSSVALAGWPYGLPAPADATATVGRVASTNACVVAVRLPWWATLSRSTCGRPSARSDGSMPSSTSPISRNRRRPDLAEQDDRDVVDAGAAIGRRRAGTWPRIGHRTRRSISSTSAGRRRRGRAAPARPAAPSVAQPRRVAGTRAAHPRLEDAADAVALEQQGEPGDVVLVRVAQDDGVDPAVPRRDPRGRAPTSRRSGSGPPSMSSRPPREPSTRIASPCPTSRIGDPGAAAGRRGDDRAGDEQRADQRDGADAGAPCDRRPAARAVADVAAVPDRPRPGSARPPAARALPVRRLGRRDHAMPASASGRDIAAATTSNGGSSVTLANGRPPPRRRSRRGAGGSPSRARRRRPRRPAAPRRATSARRPPARRRRRPSPARRAGRRRG